MRHVLPALLLCVWPAIAQIAVEPGTEVALSPDDTLDAVIAKAARVTPSQRQLAWQRLEFTCFIHFGMNTFTNREWGDGTEDPALFNPTAFDADQWAGACVDAGMTELILTAKHHDGFCLWPSAYTDHSVASSPWRGGEGDVVREVSEACRRHGLRFGIYLSPWDRHEASYGDSARYNEYFRNQLRELLGNYGEVSEVWFDGACGEGPNGKRQEYDWDSYYEVIRELQPGAVISIVGPDVRWCGNEAGHTRASEWSVIPGGVDHTAEDLGSRDVLRQAAERGASLRWFPAQVNTSIRPGWFYHPEEDDRVKSLDHLLDIYYGSVGGNAQFLLNLPPDPRGLIHEADVARLRELGQVLGATFRENLASDAVVSASASAAGHAPESILDGEAATYWTADNGVTNPMLEVTLPAARSFDRAMLQEHIQSGQRIEEFALDAMLGGEWQQIASATTVGYKRLVRFEPVTTDRVRLRILSSRVAPTLASFGLFLSPTLLRAPEISRDAAGMVSISGPEGAEVRYWVNGGRSSRYTGPFPLPAGGRVDALAVPPEGKTVAIASSLTTHREFGYAKAGWTVVGVDSEEEPEAGARQAIDDDPATFWHTAPSESAGHPHSITIDFGAVVEIAGLTYLPRQDGADGGIATRCEWYLSADGEEWGDPAAESTFDNIRSNPIEQRVGLEAPREARYVRMVVLETVEGQPWASAAEIGVLPVLPERKPEKAVPTEWVDYAIEPGAALRSSESLPLSDQANAGGWVPYEPMWDEFEGYALNRAKWHDHNPGWLGREPSFFWTENVWQSEGQLHLAMRAQEAPEMPEGYHTFTSAAVQSMGRVRYGYFEVRARAMDSHGSSAFWFYDSTPDWWTEIDVFEIGGGAPGFERQLFMTLHEFHTPAYNGLWSVGGIYHAPANLADDWHVYGLEWDEERLRFYFDGKLVREGPNTHWHQPLTMNFDSETMPDWFGLPNPEELPSVYSIDYVRSWKRGE